MPVMKSGRERLPNRRIGETFEFEVAGLRYTATVGRFSDGRLGETFLSNYKSNIHQHFEGAFGGSEPHNIEAEQCLLGAILINNEAFAAVAALVDAEDFFEPINQEIFMICCELIRAGKLVSPITVKTFVPPALKPNWITESAQGERRQQNDRHHMRKASVWPAGELVLLPAVVGRTRTSPATIGRFRRRKPRGRSVGASCPSPRQSRT
jgi:hypothetical protein